MAREPLGEAHVIVPGEALGPILGEGGVVGRIGIDEIIGVKAQFAEVGGGEAPGRELAPVALKRVGIADAAIAAEGDVERALAVEAAEAVEAGAIR